MARNFYEDSYEFEDNEFESDEFEGYAFSHEYEGYEWTEEDSWDALTDGMYGDMPSNPIDYDAMMDAMGF